MAISQHSAPFPSTYPAPASQFGEYGREDPSGAIKFTAVPRPSLPGNGLFAQSYKLA